MENNSGQTGALPKLSMSLHLLKGLTRLELASLQRVTSRSMLEHCRDMIEAVCVWT
jgi:hypothetical protein